MSTYLTSYEGVHIQLSYQHTEYTKYVIAQAKYFYNINLLKNIDDIEKYLLHPVQSSVGYSKLSFIDGYKFLFQICEIIRNRIDSYENGRSKTLTESQGLVIKEFDYCIKELRKYILECI
jgi:hypothetical protein